MLICDLSNFRSYTAVPSDVMDVLYGDAVRMIGRSAQEETVIRLFTAYSRQGIKRQKSIMLIAASLGIFQKTVLKILQKEKSVD